jgi:hypothetical protein
MSLQMLNTAIYSTGEVIAQDADTATNGGLPLYDTTGVLA